MISRIINIIERLRKNTSVTGKLVKGVSWNAMGIIVSKAFTMISSIFVARKLGTSIYGEYGIINSTISMFATFAGLGLGMTSIKMVAEFKNTDKERVGRVLGLTNLFAVFSGIIMMLIVFLSADWLSINQLNNPNLSGLLKISSLNLLINTYNGVQRGSLSGFEKFPYLAKTEVIIGVFSCVFNITSTYYFGLKGLIIASVFIALIHNLLFTYFIRKSLKEYSIKINFKEFYKEIKVFLNISLPSMLSNIMVGPVTWISNTIFVRIENGYSQMGIFNAANQWRTLLLLLPNMFSMVMLPVLVSSKNSNDKNVERINMMFSWILVIVLSIPLINIPDAISFLYGKQYISDNYNSTMVIITVIAIFLAYKEGVARKLIANDQLWLGFLSNICWAITLIVSSLLFKNYGSIGIAFSQLNAYFVSTLVFFPIYISKKIIPKELLISKTVIILWSIIIMQALISFYNFNILLRILLLLLNITAVILYFIKYFKKYSLK